MTINRTLKKADQIKNLSPDILLRGVQLRPEKEHQLMDELQEEILIRMSLSGNVMLTQQMIKQLAEELASHEKYEGFFKDYKFGEKWVTNWRKLYDIKSKIYGAESSKNSLLKITSE